MKNEAIMIPAKPKEYANILNSIQSILVRKTFLKDYVGWVYVYCTKDNKEGLHVAKDKWVCLKHNKVLKECCYNGTIIARFWCDKVEEIKYHPYDCTFYTDTLDTVICADTPVSSFEKASGLSYFELSDYLYNGKEKVGYTIHISNLETFDKPKELKEFFKKCPCKYNKGIFAKDTHISDDGQHLVVPIKSGYCYVPRMKSPPKSWCYIENA